jgi:hypothetical protein
MVSFTDDEPVYTTGFVLRGVSIRSGKKLEREKRDVISSGRERRNRSANISLHREMEPLASEKAGSISASLREITVHPG